MPLLPLLPVLPLLEEVQSWLPSASRAATERFRTARQDLSGDHLPGQGTDPHLLGT